MKTLAAAFCALSLAILSPAALHAQRQTGQSQFRIEIQQTGQRGPTYTISNLSGKAVSALVLEISASSQPARKENRRWDSLMESHSPIQPGATLSRSLYELAFRPTPDRIKVVAALFSDGAISGPRALISPILNNRAVHAAEYEDAARILQQGLSLNWTRDQYEQAFRGKPDNGAVYTVRTALSATLQTGQSPQEFTHTMQFLLTNFQEASKNLRQIKPL